MQKLSKAAHDAVAAPDAVAATVTATTNTNSGMPMLQGSGATCGPRRKSSQNPRKGAIPAPAPTIT